MSEEIKVLLPKLGESIHSATIVQWFKQIGDTVHLDEPLLEVSTDKVNSEIPSPTSGILKEIHANPDQELQVGELIAVIAAQSVQSTQTSAAAPLPATQIPANAEKSDFYTPALLRLARENGIALDQLQHIPGTGMGGRLTKNDLENYIEAQSAKPCPLSKAPCASGDVERVKMTGIRKAIAENLVRSSTEMPHGTLVCEVDVTHVLKWIQQHKEHFLATHGAKLTITSFVVHAIAKALQEYPLLNASLEADTIVVKRFIHLGIAVSIEGGLMVPVIKNCQKLSLAEMAKAIGALSTKARSKQLTPDDITEGTITLTNFGMSGVQIGIPIIRHPEVAIIGIGAICKRVVPLEDDVLAVRSMMHVTLTFDHRVFDGMYGCGFLAAMKKHLEEDAEGWK